jgi:hypothetical protein
MVIEIQKNLKAIKRTNKGEKLGQLHPFYLKLLEDGLMRDGFSL